MKHRNWSISGLLLVVLVLVLAMPASGTAQAQEPTSRVRFLHAVSGAPMVDVYVDGALAVEGLSFGDVTPHLNVPGGERQIELRSSGSGAAAPALLAVPVPLVPNLAFTVVVQGTPDALEASLYEDILDEIDLGFARLTAVNAIPDAPPLDVVTTEGGPLLQGVNYGTQFGTVNIGSGVQNLVMVPAGGAVESAVASIGEVPLRSGMLYTFVAIGTLEGAGSSSALVLETPVEGAADTVRVQFAHGSPDAPAVDVYLGETLVAPALALGDLSGHIAVPAGDYSVALRPAGAPAGDDPVLAADVSLAADTPAVTALVTGQAADASLAVNVFPEDVAGMTPEQARVRVVNAVPDAEVEAMFEDQTTLVSALAASAQGDAVEVAPGNYTMLVRVEDATNPVDLAVPEMVYAGGTYYTVLVFGGGTSGAPYDANVAATPVNVAVGSLPVSVGEPMVAEPATEDEGADSEALPATEAAQDAPEISTQPDEEPAPVVTEEPPAAEETASELVQESSELVASPETGEAVAQPTAPPIQPQQSPVAYVELDPGANLHCRELPGADMRSLGLIPSGTTLTVLGRTGTPLVPETGNVTPEPTPDPQSIEELWLSVQWDTPGGGYLRCWVNAQYLRVEYRGQLLDTLEELWTELPEEPFNRPGENLSSDVTPPTPQFDAVLATVELQPGVSLQLRRFPETSAESLDLVPAMAQLEVLGVAEAPSEGLVGQPTSPYWLYVRYRTENGGATIGWVSEEYTSLERQGRPVDIADLPLVDVSEAGYYEAPGEVQIPVEMQEVVGTVDLDPGANLNLRDRPSADARVVLGIPSGDSMVLDGRNGDGSWVHAAYETSGGTVEGWVASQYLLVTRGGQAYDIAELPILTDETDEMQG